MKVQNNKYYYINNDYDSLLSDDKGKGGVSNNQVNKEIVGLVNNKSTTNDIFKVGKHNIKYIFVTTAICLAAGLIYKKNLLVMTFIGVGTGLLINHLVKK